jgi:hypothetical protein
LKLLSPAGQITVYSSLSIWRCAAAVARAIKLVFDATSIME